MNSCVAVPTRLIPANPLLSALRAETPATITPAGCEGALIEHMQMKRLVKNSSSSLGGCMCVCGMVGVGGCIVQCFGTSHCWRVSSLPVVLVVVV